MISRVNGVVINDEEARLLCGSANLIKCARIILSYGTEFVIIKKGEHGSLFLKDECHISNTWLSFRRSSRFNRCWRFICGWLLRTYS